jgi:6-phosphogluconolactonase
LIGFAWDASRGTLREIQNINTVPESFLGINNSAEVQAHPNGKFLYVSNRGADMLAVLSVDQAKGTVRIIQQEPSRGISPRNFAIDPSGSFLFVANNYTENVLVFRIDGQSGRIDLLVRGGLQQTAKVLKIGAPVCVKFVPVK